MDDFLTMICHNKLTLSSLKGIHYLPHYKNVLCWKERMKTWNALIELYVSKMSFRLPQEINKEQ